MLWLLLVSRCVLPRCFLLWKLTSQHCFLDTESFWTMKRVPLAAEDELSQLHLCLMPVRLLQYVATWRGSELIDLIAILRHSHPNRP